MSTEHPLAGGRTATVRTVTGTYRGEPARLDADVTLDCLSLVLIEREDPAAWVTERRYMEQDFGTALRDFRTERNASLAWLRGLDLAPWTNAYQHPKVGPVSCELLLTNWVAHDLLHIRQLTALRYAYLKAHTTVPLDYAGTW